MNTWESIFTQSPANYGYYDEHNLPHVRWQWPRATWFRRAGNICANVNRSRPVKSPPITGTDRTER